MYRKQLLCDALDHRTTLYNLLIQNLIYLELQLTIYIISNPHHDDVPMNFSSLNSIMISLPGGHDDRLSLSKQSEWMRDAPLVLTLTDLHKQDQDERLTHWLVTCCTNLKSKEHKGMLSLRLFWPLIALYQGLEEVFIILQLKPHQDSDSTSECSVFLDNYIYMQYTIYWGTLELRPAEQWISCLCECAISN